MKTVQVSGQSPSLQEVLSLAREEGLILRLDDGQSFVLTEMDDFELEVRRTRQNEELMQLLDERSEPKETFGPDEIRKQLGLK